MITCLVIIFCSLLFSCHAEKPIVVTPLGVIEGYWTTTVNNKQYAAFDGIPYAIPPLGQYRFEEPNPVKPWKGVWKADVEYRCLQYFHYTGPKDEIIIGNEDCLYLNVYTPKVNEARMYDVIVFIHGGAFMFNSASVYGHKYIMDRDIVFVSTNYRLGPLGFLSTEDKILPGNNGLKDQLLALKWINQNIQYFGGNPDAVTLTGMSAGGASVHIHYISPLSQGLFHRGIAQSGTALNNWVLAENSREKAKKLGLLVGCNFQDSNALLKCLKSRSAYQIVNTVGYFQCSKDVLCYSGRNVGENAELDAVPNRKPRYLHWSKQIPAVFHTSGNTDGCKLRLNIAARGSAKTCMYSFRRKASLPTEWLYNPFSPFGVVIDKFANTPVLPKHPFILLKNGEFKHIPLVISCVEAEGLYPAADFLREPEYLINIDQRWNDLIPHILDYNYTVPLTKKNEISTKIRRKYLDDKNVNRGTFPLLVKMISDRLFIADIEMAAKLHASHTNASIYFYYFTYRGAHSKSEIRSKTHENLGASHADDTVYILSSNVNTRTTQSDVKMTDTLLDMWVEYARTSIPKFKEFGDWVPLDKVYETTIRYLHIASPENVKMETIDTLSNRSFWRSLGFLENENLFKEES